MRVLGIALTFLSAVTYLLTARVICGKEEQFVQDLLAAVECLEILIRWEKRTLPDSITQQVSREYVGEYFSKVLANMKSNTTLQQAWINTFEMIEPKEISRILCAVTLTGDSEYLQGQLAFAAAQIRKFQQNEQQKKPEKLKLRTALALSAAGLAVILLL